MGSKKATGGFPGFSDFVESRRNKFRFKPATAEFYEKELGYLFRRAGELGIKHPSDFNDRSIEDLEGLLSKTAGRVTVRKYMRALKTYLRWCEGRGLIDCAPKITIPHIETLIEPLRPDEFAKLLQAAKKSTQPKRNVALLMVMGRAGLRAGEVCRLKVDDFKNGQLRLVYTKTGRDRFLPLPDKVATAVEQYLRKERPRCYSEYLFVNAEGGQLTDNALRLMLRRLSDDTGVKVHPHLLRHSFAFLGVLQGVPMTVIQFMLGHTTLEMTKRYINLSGGDAARWRSAWD